MKIRRYTQEQLEYLREGYKTMNVECLTIAFNAEFGTNKNECAIRATLKNNRFKCGRSPKKRIVLNRFHIFTQEQEDFIRRKYKMISVAEMTAIFNERFGDVKTKQQIRTFVKNRGITSGRTGCFERGHTPHNKGKKGWDAGGRSSKTRFKKGNRPQTWVPIGSVRTVKGGILQRKVSDTGYTPRDWKSVHRLLWEKHNGPVPKNHLVVFCNGNVLDIRIENLELISRAENMRRNSIHNLPEPLKEVVRIRGVLNRHINKRMGKNEKQD